MVTPQPDGSIAVGVEHLPDPNNTYVVRTKSFLSSYTLDVQLDNGMLKTVSLSSKSDALAAAAIETSGNLAKAKIEAEAKERDEAAKVAEASAKELKEAQTALAVAEAKRDIIEQTSGTTAEQKLNAALAVAEAKAKVDLLTSSASSGSSFNDPETNGLQAAGPIFYRVVPDGEGVKLVAAAGERMFETSNAAKPAEPSLPDLAFEVVNGSVVQKQPGQLVRFTVKANRPFAAVQSDGIVFSAAQAAAPHLPQFFRAADVNTVDGVKVILVTLAPETPPGTYRLVLPLIIAAQPVRGPEIQITIVG
jgi:hypothetical protein